MSSVSRVASGHLASILDALLADARELGYEGYSKHDALNAPWLETLAGASYLRRLALIQAVMRCPFHIRPVLGVRTARDPKGIALFARALLARYRLTDHEPSALEAGALLDWLVSHPAPAVPWTAWGYPYPWQDVGFFAPRHYPNRVVTSFVVQALLDGFHTLKDERYLRAAVEGVRFLVDAPKRLVEDRDHLCVSYVPSEAMSWIVLDVPALAGASAARLAAVRGDAALEAQAAKLLRYVVAKQTEYGAWYYADPPSASHIGHDNYHTGFILDALLGYQQSSGSAEFGDAYRRGLGFYRRSLFEADGAPRFMSRQRFPYDIHGAAQGIITFALAEGAGEEGAAFSRKVLGWTMDHLYESDSHWFSYQQGRFCRRRVRLLRWCQAWMAWAIACHLEYCGEPG